MYASNAAVGGLRPAVCQAGVDGLDDDDVATPSLLARHFLTHHQAHGGARDAPWYFLFIFFLFFWLCD